MKLYKILFLITFVLLSKISKSQIVPLENKIYASTVHTVLLYSNISDYAFPVINLNSAEQFNLSFDELLATNDNYYYTLILCNADWKPVNMQPNEYLIGSAFESIDDHSFSLGTYQNYVHYSASFPTENMKIRYAGNYIVKVYRNFNEEDVILTQRCFVMNKKANIGSKVHQAVSLDQRYTNQEVDIEVDVSNATIPSPYTDAKLSILQNGRFDNAITSLIPKYINGNMYNYDYEEGNLFYGGNEFRAFDVRNIHSVGQNVSNKTIDTAIHVQLRYDESRGAQQHLALTDYNGKFLIVNSTGSAPNLLDYTYVTFTLNAFSSEGQNNLYVLGSFNQWQPSANCKLEYNASRKIYQCTIFLKQGYYNYGYYAMNADGLLENTDTEGNHYETENDYYIFFYQKNYSYNFDELIGYQKSNSGTMERR